jgi:hypothetical protein
MQTLIKVAKIGYQHLMMKAVSFASKKKSEMTEIATLKSVNLVHVSWFQG